MKKILPFLVGLFLTTVAHAAIAVETTYNLWTSGGNWGITETHSITVGSVSNSCLACFTYAFDGTAGDTDVTSITFNGDSLTEALDPSSYLDTGVARLRITAWYLLTPDVTTGNLVITMGGANYRGMAGCVLLSGVQQSSQPDATASANSTAGESANPSSTITTVSDNSLILTALLGSHEAVTINSVSVGTIHVNNTDDEPEFALASYTKASAGSQAVSYNLSAAQAYQMVQVSFKPAVTATRRVIVVT